MITTDFHATHVEVSIVLADGSKAGTGKAGTYENALYFAAKDAIISGVERFETAGHHYMENYCRSA